MSPHLRNAMSYKNLINNLKSSWRGELMSRHYKKKEDRGHSSNRDSTEIFRDMNSHSAGKKTEIVNFEDVKQKRQ